MIIRTFQSADVDQVVALALRAWAPVHESMAAVLGPDINAELYPDWRISQERDVRSACSEQLTSVACRGQRILGFVTVRLDGPQEPGEVCMIAVDPPAQRAGVGRALMDHALGQIRDAGCRVAVVSTGADPGHAAARELYESCGFTPFPLANYYRMV